MTSTRETPVLRAFLSTLLATHRPVVDPAALPPAQRRAAGALYFLLDTGPPREPGVERFVTYTLDRLLVQLSRESERRPVTYQGQVRGRVLWPQTIKARHAEDFDPTRFVCRELVHRYDTPENRLLKYLLEQIAAAIAAVPPVMRGGFCYFPARRDGGAHFVDAQLRLAHIEAAVNRARYHVRLRDVTTVDAVSDEQLRLAEQTRQEEYIDVVRLYRRFRILVQGAELPAPGWSAALIRAGGRALPLPATTAGGASWLALATAVLRHHVYVT
jgi:predicted nucleic acid-binding protein